MECWCSYLPRFGSLAGLNDTEYERVLIDIRSLTLSLSKGGFLDLAV